MTIRSTLGAAAAAAALTVTPAAAEVTLINVFAVPEGREEAVIAAWEKARDFLSREPGYIDTALHRAIGPDARFALVNIAHWQSPDAFMTATKRMQAAGIFPPVEGLEFHPALYRVVRSDEPEAAGGDK